MLTQKQPPSAELDAPALQALAENFSGQIILPDDPDYDLGRLVWNGMIDRYPAIILQPAQTSDVAAAVNFAREQGLPLAVRGGGHNVAGLGSVDRGIVVDLARMNQVAVDPAARRVKVGGGARLGEMDQAAQAYGLVVPAGVVSDTGVAGLTLSGGFGWLSSKFGLTCDNLVGAEVVTADGRVVYASEQENADLLWGLRGGGGNFGIVTRFEFQAYPLGPEIMLAFVFHDGENMFEAVKFFRDFMASAPDEVSGIAFAGMFPPGAEAFPEHVHGKRFIAFGAMYAGSAEEGERVLAPLREFAPPLVDFSGQMPYLQAQTMFDEDYPKYEMRYYWKSLNLLELNDEVIARYVEHARRQPSPYNTTDLWPIKGKARADSQQTGAFAGRHAAYLLNPEANWIEPEDDEANIQWVREFVEEMGEFSDGSRYLNFAGFLEEGREERLIKNLPLVVL
ncbi:MAG: FAD-binding oxidoreductase, partial [Anaerolineales bacterium]